MVETDAVERFFFPALASLSTRATRLLPRGAVLPGGIAMDHRGHLALLDLELDDDGGELLEPELARLPGLKNLEEAPRGLQSEASVLLQDDLDLDSGRGEVRPGVGLEGRRARQI